MNKLILGDCLEKLEEIKVIDESPDSYEEKIIIKIIRNNVDYTTGRYQELKKKYLENEK